MRKILGGIMILLLSGVTVAALAASKAAGSKIEDAKKKASNLSFEDLLIQGKYHVQNESVSTVEADKILDALLGLRKDFRDRVERSFTNY